jgi:hypothetical protein
MPMVEKRKWIFNSNGAFDKMIEIFRIATSGFWQFIAVCAIIYIPLQFTYGIIHKVIRSITISKHGYPPPHCDGDGDAYKED